jgi:hypothetical protein
MAHPSRRSPRTVAIRWQYDRDDDSDAAAVVVVIEI